MLEQLPGLLLPWFAEHRRDLPWRRDREPYHVWLSEIMLQQTRVEAVRGYYLRFLHKLHPRGDRPPLAEPPAGPEDTPRREKPMQDKPRPPQPAAPALPRRSGRELSDLELSLLRILDDKIPLLIDEAADRLQLPVAQVLSAVTIMEIDGLIRREGMRKYLRTVEVEETKE